MTRDGFFVETLESWGTGCNASLHFTKPERVFYQTVPRKGHPEDNPGCWGWWTGISSILKCGEKIGPHGYYCEKCAQKFGVVW